MAMKAKLSDLKTTTLKIETQWNDDACKKKGSFVIMKLRMICESITWLKMVPRWMMKWRLWHVAGSWPRVWIVCLKGLIWCGIFWKYVGSMVLFSFEGLCLVRETRVWLSRYAHKCFLNFRKSNFFNPICICSIQKKKINFVILILINNELKIKWSQVR